MPRPSHYFRFYHPNNTGWALQIMKLIVVFSTPLLPRPCQVQIFSSTPYFQTPSAYVSPSMSATKFHTHTEQRAKL
jgi:hypothetical protein